MSDNNEEEKSSGMGFMGGFGAPGFRESKKVSGGTEIYIPATQSIAIVIGTTIALFLVYLTLKIFIVSYNDWLMLIGILTIIGLPILANISLRIIGRHFSSIAFDMSRWAFIVFWTIIFIIVYVIVNFYITVIARQMATTLNGEAHIVFFVCFVIGTLSAYRPFRTFFVRQLTDTLRDSDSKYAVRSLEIENENRWRQYQIIDDDPEPEQLPAPQEMTGVALLRTNPRSKSISPADRAMLAVEEFLDGIEDDMWTTAESSWVGKRLNKSGYNLSRVGDSIRDLLIKSGWAEWLDADQPRQGWRIRPDVSIDDIRAEVFKKSLSETGVDNN